MNLRKLLSALPQGLRRQKLIVALHRCGLIEPLQRLDYDGGGRAWVDIRDAGCRANYLAESFWPEFYPIVAAFLREGGDFLDVGAHFGLVTFGVAPLVRGTEAGFHLFEANATIIPALERSVAEWPGEHFFVNHGCVTDRPGVSRLTLPDGSWGHAHIGESGQAVPNLLLDSYIAERQISRIAFMKMDVNGFEVRALRGATGLLQQGRIGAAFVEVVPQELAVQGETAQELLDFMRQLGFDPYFCALWEDADPFGLEWTTVPVHGTAIRFAAVRALPPSYTHGDVLFVRTETEVGKRLRDRFARLPLP